MLQKSFFRSFVNTHPGDKELIIQDTNTVLGEFMCNPMLYKCYSVIYNNKNGLYFPSLVKTSLWILPESLGSPMYARKNFGRPVIKVTKKLRPFLCL